LDLIKDCLADSYLQFLTDNWLQGPFAMPNVADRYRGLVSWDMILEIIDSKANNCWLPKDGVLPDESSGILTSKQASEGFLNGRTVLIRHAEKFHPVLDQIGFSVQQEFSAPVDIQIYATPANEEGFGWHFDKEDVFAIQTAGIKEFSLCANSVYPDVRTMDMPERLEFNRETSPEIRCTLRAGDILYIPAGYWHRARAVSNSIHMSIGIMVSDINSKFAIKKAQQQRNLSEITSEQISRLSS
jgi:50S ribosomal protein L16 3-hydroxylase